MRKDVAQQQQQHAIFF